MKRQKEEDEIGKIKFPRMMHMSFSASYIRKQRRFYSNESKIRRPLGIKITRNYNRHPCNRRVKKMKENEKDGFLYYFGGNAGKVGREERRRELKQMRFGLLRQECQDR